MQTPRRLDPASSEYLTALHERVVIFDGATGTNLQRQGLSTEQFGGTRLDGCNEVLAIACPAAVEAVHRAFLEVGVDVIETDTFGASPLHLEAYGIATRATEVNLAAAGIARRLADEFAAPGAPRWVAGSIGPGTKFPTLGQVPFTALRAAYEEQAAALLDGGVDLLLVETVLDLLCAKAAIIGARRAMASTGRQVPLQVQVTIEETGRMLPGTEIGAALGALDALQVDVVGLNCATGPAGMDGAVRYLCAHSRVPVSVMPSAGIPTVVEGRMHYDLSPEQLASHLHRFVTDYGVEAVGGCCGTTQSHLEAVVERVRCSKRARRDPVHVPAACSLYRAVPLRERASVLLVGRRTHEELPGPFPEVPRAAGQGSSIATIWDQVARGVQMLHVGVDRDGAGGMTDMAKLARRLSTQSHLPLMIDSGDASVVEAALQWLGGRPLLRSVDFSEGGGEGTRIDLFLRLAREYGAAVVCSCVDEGGHARTAERKLRAARAIHDLAVDRYGFEPADLLFDPLVLPVSTGTEEGRRGGAETLEAITSIEESLPGAHTIVELSNISRGFRDGARQALESVFLHECLEAGLDAAVVDTSRILAPSCIDGHVRELCLDLFYDRRRPGYDPLERLVVLFERDCELFT